MLVDDKFNEFLADKKYIKTLIGNLIVMIMFLGLLIFSKIKHNSIAFYVLMTLIILIIIYLSVDILISYYLDKVKKIPDLAISDSEIVFFYGTFKRKKIVKISDIESVYIPKWDEYIELTFKDKIEMNLNLKGYSEESTEELRNIFNSIKNGIDGSKETEEIKTYYLANGKNYIKKEL